MDWNSDDENDGIDDEANDDIDTNNGSVTTVIAKRDWFLIIYSDCDVCDGEKYD